MLFILKLKKWWKQLLWGRKRGDDPTQQDGGSSPKNSIGVSFPDGVKVLYDCPDALVDVCFIHGLTGDRESTWTAAGQSKPWPETLLPQKLKKARILTYGYDAYVVRKGVAGTNSLLDHATNLVRDLTTDRSSCQASSRPLFFVAHSLGGLVCKKAVLHSRNNPDKHLRDIFNSTKGIAFMGTPHRGSWLADWADIPLSVFLFGKSTNMKLVDVLQRDNEFLKSIRVEFAGMIREREENGTPIEIACFFEELPVPVIQKTVVSKDSASFEGHDPISIHADHSGMVRFSTTEDTGFKRLLGELARWQSKIEPVLEVTNLEPSQDCLDCLKSLAFPEMNSRFYDIDCAMEGTCEWLLSHQKFNNWVEQSKGLLWIKGNPGTGKSTLLRYALNRHMQQIEGNDLIVSFFFHGRGNDLQKNTLGFFRSVVHQMLSKVPSAFSGLVAEFLRKQVQIGEPGEKWQWHEEELRQAFKSSLPNLLQTCQFWLYIDALDECGEENAVGLLQYFQNLLQTLPSTGIHCHIIIACRHYPVVNEDPEFDICPEHENAPDIATFVKGRLSEKFPPPSQIPDLIERRASGIFMWARLVVEQVLSLNRKGSSPKKIRETVNSIPKDLDGLYRNLIEGMDSDSLRLMQWICFATWPLSTDELRWAMAIEPDSQYRSFEEISKAEAITDKEDFEKQIQTLSRGLAEITPSAEKPVVQFIHQSVKDFFVDKGLAILDHDSKLPDFLIGTAHLQLCKTCIRYFTMKDIEQPESYNPDRTKAEYPLLKYAVTSWAKHAKESEIRDVNPANLLEIIAWPSNIIIDQWRCVYSMIDSHPRLPRKQATLLHVAATYGMPGLLKAILKDIDHIAQQINSRDEDGRTPLSWAAERGEEAVVKLLLSTGQVEVDSRDESGRTPLSLAAESGEEAVVKLLLSTGQVEVDSRDENGQTPLSWAVESGEEAVVKLLLSTGQVEVDSRDENGRTPLSWATLFGKEAVVKLLLSTGQVEVNLRDKNGRTLLSLAAESGKEAVVKLLLSTGQAEVDSRDENGQTPLSLAAESGKEAVVKLLLSTGQAEVDSRDENGQTPLSLAAESGKEAIVKLLLSTGQVEVDSRDKNGRTPLSLAAWSGKEAVVKLLLSTGQAEVDSRDENGQTPLSWAAWSGEEAIVKLLLSTGQVEVDSRDKNGRTPLSGAAWRGKEAVVKLLLSTGQVEVDSRDENGRTPLSWAAWRGEEAVVKLLLSTGQVEVDSRDEDGQTPLHLASEEGHKEVVKLLLDTGQAKVDSVDRHGNTPMSVAIKGGHKAVIELLDSAVTK